MPTDVGILTFMSMIDFMLSWVKDEKRFYNLVAWMLIEVYCISVTSEGYFNP